MDFKAIRIVGMAAVTLMDEMIWGAYGSQGLHTPVIQDDHDCRRLEMLMDMLGTLTRLLDTRIAFVTAEGKAIREWIETILEIAARYEKELDAAENARKLAP